MALRLMLSSEVRERFQGVIDETILPRYPAMLPESSAAAASSSP
jgi:hypothetical protein